MIWDGPTSNSYLQSFRCMIWDGPTSNSRFVIVALQQNIVSAAMLNPYILAYGTIGKDNWERLILCSLTRSFIFFSILFSETCPPHLDERPLPPHSYVADEVASPSKSFLLSLSILCIALSVIIHTWFRDTTLKVWPIFPTSQHCTKQYHMDRKMS